MKISALILLLITIITLLLIVISLIVTYNYSRINKLVTALNHQNQEIQRLNQSLEIKALRSQMDPHFVFNALNGLQHFLNTRSKEDSGEYLGRISRLVRITLQNASKDWVKVREEIELLRLYLHIEQYRFPGKFEFTFEIEARTENEKIPFLVIQPYVENAVLHGLIPRAGDGGILTIQTLINDKALLVIIEDNGVGRGNATRMEDAMFTSMGSGLVKERLRKLTLQVGILMDVKTDDLYDGDGNATGTRSTLFFELQQENV